MSYYPHQAGGEAMMHSRVNPEQMMARLSAELQESRMEISMGANALENAHEHVRILGTQLAELRENLEVKEIEYKRMWSTEEERIKNLSDEARRQVEGVRARLIGGLERIDLSNRSMIEASQTLQSIDKDLDTLFGEGAPATTGAGLSDWA